MQTRQAQTFGSSFSSLLLTCITIVFLLWQPDSVRAQDDQTPNRGFHPASSYALGEIETINTTSGNLMLNIPLGSLPPGRGGLSGGVRLLYNGKLYDSSPSWAVYQPSQFSPPQAVQQNLLERSNAGGWHYGLRYSLQSFDRMDQYIGLAELPENANPTPRCPPPTLDVKALYRYKLQLTFPDGSAHELIPQGYSNGAGDGYYKVARSGYVWDCSTGSFLTNQKLVYSTSDGTYLRLEIDLDSDPNTIDPWTLYFPDGERVTDDESGAGGQLIYDRNKHLGINYAV